MPKIKVKDAELDQCDFHEVLEAIAGQSHLVRIGHYGSAARSVYLVTVNKLPEDFYSFTETECFTRRTPYLNEEGVECGMNVSIDLGSLKKEAFFDDLTSAMLYAQKFITKYAVKRCALEG